MAVCAMARAVLADRSLRASSCALAGAARAQTMPMPARRYNATDIAESSLDLQAFISKTARGYGGLRRQTSVFPRLCTASHRWFPVGTVDVVSAGLTTDDAQWR